MRPLAYFTIKDLLHDRWRSLMAIVSLAFMVVSFLILSALSRAYAQYGRSLAISNNLVIIAADVLDPMESELPDDILAAAQAIAPDQIRNTWRSIFRLHNIEGNILQVNAVPLQAMMDSMDLVLLEGGWPTGRQEIAISEGAAQVSRKRIGSAVNIYGSEFTVAGILKTPGSRFSSIWMDYDAGKRLFNPERGFQLGYLQLHPNADTESVRVTIQADPRFSNRYSVYTWSTIADRYNQVNQKLLVLARNNAIIALLVITFGSFNATRLTLSERAREIVLLNMIGFSRRKLLYFLCARSLVLAVAGYGGGWAAAVLTLLYMRTYTPINIQAAHMRLELTPGVDMLGFGLVVLFALAGVWLTSGSIARINLASGRQ